jgi:hypothetical protein
MPSSVVSLDQLERGTDAISVWVMSRRFPSFHRIGATAGSRFEQEATERPEGDPFSVASVTSWRTRPEVPVYPTILDATSPVYKFVPAR